MKSVLLITIICCVIVVISQLAATFATSLEIGCGIFLPSDDKIGESGKTNTVAVNQSILNSFCSNWQCSRAVPVKTLLMIPRATKNINPLGSTVGGEEQEQEQQEKEITHTVQRHVCVRGAAAGEPCAIDSDCYRDHVCKNVSFIVANATDKKNNGTTMQIQQTVCVKHKESAAQSALGFIFVSVATLFWGSNFVFARNAKSGNGILFQFFMCSTVLLVGFFVQVIRASWFDRAGFVFYPYASIGGCLFVAGNTFALPLINLLGVGLAVSLWGASNMIFGTASSAWGLWGLKKQKLAEPAFLYVGVLLGIVSFVLLAFVRPTRHDKKKPRQGEDVVDESNNHNKISTADCGGDEEKQKKLLNNSNGESSSLATQETEPLVVAAAAASSANQQQLQRYGQQDDDDVNAEVVVDDKEEFPIISLVGGVRNARLVGVVGAVCAGVLFGLNNDPLVRLLEHYASDSETNVVKSSSQAADYVMSHFAGIFFSSFFMLICLGIFETLQKKYPHSALGRLPLLFGAVDEPMTMLFPACCAGLFWALAQFFSFMSEGRLGMAIVYPTVCLGPGLIASLWSLIFFKELEGRRNLMLLIFAFLVGGGSCGFTVAARG